MSVTVPDSYHGKASEGEVIAGSTGEAGFSSNTWMLPDVGRGLPWDI